MCSPFIIDFSLNTLERATIQAKAILSLTRKYYPFLEMLRRTKKIKSSKLPQALYQGKIRTLYPVDEHSLVMVTSDRVSAFDVVFPQTIKNKGVILNHISCAWCHALELGEYSLCKQYNFSTHLLSEQLSDLPKPYCHHPELVGRAVHIKKTKRIDFECIVRGYLAGTAWKEYQATGSVCGIALAKGLQLGAKLSQPLFTPSTKAEIGQHDVNVSYSVMQKRLGKKLSERLRDISIAIYNFSAKKWNSVGLSSQIQSLSLVWMRMVN